MTSLDVSSLIIHLFSFLQSLKVYHWTTGAYPRHSASDQLHKTLSELSDRLVETAIATYDRPKFDKSTDIPLVQNTDPNQVESLKLFKQYLISGVQFADDDVDLKNTRDEMVSAINQALYLFTLW